MLTCKRNKGFIAHIDKLRSYLDAPEGDMRLYKIVD